eukprot:1135627-Amphidinium_carterae.2
MRPEAICLVLHSLKATRSSPTANDLAGKAGAHTQGTAAMRTEHPFHWRQIIAEEAKHYVEEDLNMTSVSTSLDSKVRPSNSCLRHCSEKLA